MESKIGFIPWTAFSVLFVFWSYSGIKHIIKLRTFIQGVKISTFKRPFIANLYFVIFVYSVFILQIVKSIRSGILSMPVILFYTGVLVWFLYIYIVGKHSGIYKNGLIINAIYLSWDKIESLESIGDNDFTVVLKKRNVKVKLTENEETYIRDHIPNSE